MRVIDLLAAALPEEKVAALKAQPVAKTADGAPHPEIAALVEARLAFHAAVSTLAEAEDDPINLISECGSFSRVLSRHWPLLIQLRYPPA
jgi:hypothetical protein